MNLKEGSKERAFLGSFKVVIVLRELQLEEVMVENFQG